MFRAAQASCIRRFHAGAQAAKARRGQSEPNVPAKGSAAAQRAHARGRIEDVKDSLRQQQYVLDNFEIPGKYQKFLTGKMRKREVAQWDRKLAGPDEDGLVRVAARSVVVDKQAHDRKADMLSGQIKRILEAHLAGDQLPVRQLSLQYWEIAQVIVAPSLRSAVCYYQLTSSSSRDDMRPYHVRQAVQDSAAYLSAVVNQELAKGAGRSIGATRPVRVRFVNGVLTPALADAMQAEIQAHGDRNPQQPDVSDQE
ncbi:hypothetical protein H4R19_001339 [Coemansia spiralis]|nr:hypothetical protein H4R19_001339 [Coemansia spiralis]